MIESGMKPPEEKYRKNSPLFTVSALGIVLVALTGCQRGRPPSASATPSAPGKRKVEVIQVTKGTLKNVIEVPVSLEGYQRTSLASKLEAYVGEVKVDIGQEVQKGDILATLKAPEMLAERDRRLKMMTMSEKTLKSAEADKATATAQVAQAKASLAEQQALLKLRESELDRIRGLVSEKVIIRERLNEAQYSLDSVLASVSKIKADIAATEAAASGQAAKVESARAEVDVSRAELHKVVAEANYLEIRAPYNGLITERLVDPGALVLPAARGGSSLFTIEDVETLKAVMYISIDEAAGIDAGDQLVIHSLQGHPAGFTIPPDPETEPLTISRFGNSLNLDSRMMRLEADLQNPKNPATESRLLRPGEYGKASLTLKRVADVSIVPESAVAHGESGPYVVKVNSENVCEFVPVEVAITAGGNAGVIPSRGTLESQNVIATDAAEFKEGEKLSGDHISKADN